MPLKAQVLYPRMDIPATEAEIRTEMIDRVTEACKTFVMATTDVIPVLTGGTKATFLKLASQARVTLSISPTRTSRVPLGLESSTGEIFADGNLYGFRWESDLYYIGYVHALVVPFIEYGLQSLERVTVQLPPPSIER